MTWKWLKKENLKRETAYLLITAQINIIRINYIKAKIDNTQRLCGDRYEMVDHIISECSKRVQKEYKTKHDRVAKVIYWELSK